MEVSLTWVVFGYLVLGAFVNYGPEWEMDDGTPMIENDLWHQVLLWVLWPIPIFYLFWCRWIADDEE